jgi:ABC-type transport system involved in multi-copper enzyme maturation permease subunit
MKLLTATTTATANKAVATRLAPTTLLIIVMTLIGVLPSSFMSTTTISVVNAQQQTIEEEDANLLLNMNPDRIMDISFGYWCSDAVFDCAIRSFATLGGELVMIDSVSLVQLICLFVCLHICMLRDVLCHYRLVLFGVRVLRERESLLFFVKERR